MGGDAVGGKRRKGGAAVQKQAGGKDTEGGGAIKCPRGGGRRCIGISLRVWWKQGYYGQLKCSESSSSAVSNAGMCQAVSFGWWEGHVGGLALCKLCGGPPSRHGG